MSKSKSEFLPKLSFFLYYRIAEQRTQPDGLRDRAATPLTAGAGDSVAE